MAFGCDEFANGVTSVRRDQLQLPYVSRVSLGSLRKCPRTMTLLDVTPEKYLSLWIGQAVDMRTIVPQIFTRRARFTLWHIRIVTQGAIHLPRHIQ